MADIGGVQDWGDEGTASGNGDISEGIPNPQLEADYGYSDSGDSNAYTDGEENTLVDDTPPVVAGSTSSPAASLGDAGATGTNVTAGVAAPATPSTSTSSAMSGHLLILIVLAVAIAIFVREG